MAGETGKSTLDQMNQILAEKEALIDKKKQDLIDYRKELEGFEAELTERTKELQAGQKKLLEDKASFEEFRRTEENRIDERWKELQVYEENLKKSMEEVLQEKVILQSKSVEQLEKELEDESTSLKSGEKMDLNALRESVGIPVVETVVKTIEPDVKPVTEELEIEVPKVVPEMFSAIQSEVEKAFKMQKPFVLEKTPERLCMKLGVRELRVFDKSPYPELNLVVNHKNAKNDSKLQRLITTVARTNPDWMFETEDNQLVCRLYFKHDETPKVLVKKIKECIDVIEN